MSPNSKKEQFKNFHTLQKHWESFGVPNQSQINFNKLKTAKNILPFVGAGMSKPFNYPLWSEFLQNVIEDNFTGDTRESLENALQNKDYLALAEDINERLNDGLAEQVREYFDELNMVEPDNNYLEILNALGVRNIFTTNYDNVIERHFKTNSGNLEVLLPTTKRTANEYHEFARRGIPTVVKLHGSYDVEHSIVLTKSQYETHYLSPNPVLEPILAQAFQTNEVLFLGCSLEKDYLLDTIYGISQLKHPSWSYAILPYPNDKKKFTEMKSYLLTHKIRPIWYPQGEPEYVNIILKELLQQTSKSYERSKNLSKNGENAERINKIADAIMQSSNTADSIVKAILLQTPKMPKQLKRTSKSILHSVVNNTSSKSLIIRGEVGTGKSTLISVLYKDFFRIYSDTDYIVDLIDLHLFYDTANPEKMIEDKLCHLSVKTNRSDKCVVIFVNGIKEYYSPTDDLEKKVIDFYQKHSRKRNIKFVFAINIASKGRNDIFAKKKKPLTIPSQTPVIQLSAIDAEKSNSNAQKMVNAIIGISELKKFDRQKRDSLSSQTVVCCKAISNNYVDFRTAYFLLSYLDEKNDEPFTPVEVSGIFHRFFYQQYGDRWLVYGEKIAKSVINSSFTTPAPCLDIYSSPSFRDFLLAEYYFNQLLEMKIDNLKTMDYIFTPSINFFIRGLINSSPKNSEAIVNNIIAMWEQFNIGQKAQMAYLLGRINYDHSSACARRFLISQYHRLSNQFDEIKETPEILMLFRTIGISLIYCGELECSNDFYKKLIYDSKLSEVNLSFHINYYSSKGYKLGDNIEIDKDKITKEKQKTLYDFLYHSIFIKQSNNRYINIITFIHLLIYWQLESHEVGFQTDESQPLVAILNKLSSDNTIENPVILTFIRKVTPLLLFKNPYEETMADLFNLKAEQRQGWLKSGRLANTTDRIESVADHTWGCCLLAQVFLSNNIWDVNLMNYSEKKRIKNSYDKGKIISMLTVHDLAECYTGDLIPEEKNNITATTEEEQFRSFRVWDALPAYSSFNEIANLWAEFNERKTINAKIAHDIDKLEPLFQLYLYRQRLIPENKEQVKDEWINGLDLETQFGRNLLNFVTTHILSDDTY